MTFSIRTAPAAAVLGAALVTLPVLFLAPGGERPVLWYVATALGGALVGLAGPAPLAGLSRLRRATR